MSAQAELPDILTIVEAALYLRLDRRTVAKLLRRGELAGVQVAGRWRIPRKALEEYIGNNGRRREV